MTPSRTESSARALDRETPPTVRLASRRRRAVLSGAVALAAAAVLVGCVASGHPKASGGHESPTPDPSRTVEAPGGGTIDDQLPAPTEAPTVSAAFGASAEVASGLTIEIASVTPIKVKASTPGEVSGSAVRVGVRVENDSASAASVDSAWVTVVASDGTYGVGTTAGDPRPLSGAVAPGATTEGEYVFMLPDPRGRSVSVSVSYAAGAPVARFEGTIS